MAELSLNVEHAFDVTIYFDKRWIFPVPGGDKQGYVSVKHGTVAGPRLNGTVVPGGGADWANVRPDGVIELNAHYMLEVDDGTKIYIRNQGYVIPPKMAEGQDPNLPPQVPGYFRCTPYFRVEQGKHDWLNRTVIVGTGERRPGTDTNPDHSIFRYWAVL